MNKTLFEKFTSWILKAGPIVQFIAIVLCNNVYYYSSNDPSYTNLFMLINLLGITAIGCWYYSIAYVADFHIQEREGDFGFVKRVEWCILMYYVFSAGITVFHFPVGVIYFGDIRITFYEPLIMSIGLILSYVFSLVYLSKLLIYAEMNRHVDFKGYYKTALLLMFPIVGIWFIHYRLERLKHIRHKNEDPSEQDLQIVDPDEYKEEAHPEKTLTKREYLCKEGLLDIYQEYQHINRGEKVFLNGRTAADGKYKIGFISTITVVDGRVDQMGMF